MVGCAHRPPCSRSAFFSGGPLERTSITRGTRTGPRLSQGRSGAAPRSFSTGLPRTSGLTATMGLASGLDERLDLGPGCPGSSGFLGT